jgi:hypothetical protein
VKHVHDTPLILVGKMWAELVDWAKKNLLKPELGMACPEDMTIPVCMNTADEAIALLREPFVGSASEKRRNEGGPNMKSFVMILTATLLPWICFAAPIEKLYYVGEVKLSDLSGKPYTTQVILLEKVLDPDSSQFVERAIVVKADRRAEEFTMIHKVSDNKFTLEDPKGKVTGSGTLFGPAWKWTYFKGTYEATNGARIENENFMTDPNVLVARKRISGPDGKTIGFMDITLKAITPQTFEILAASLLKK